MTTGEGGDEVPDRSHDLGVCPGYGIVSVTPQPVRADLTGDSADVSGELRRPVKCALQRRVWQA